MRRYYFLLVFFIFNLTACAHKPASDQLYQDLGSYDGISQIVHQLILEIANDPVVKPRYKGVSMAKFKSGLSTYICNVTGGPCEYKNDSMHTIHAGHQYTHTEFNALVANLITAMEKQKVPVATQNQLLNLLAKSYKDVVYH
jgi:hemoglobin